MFTAVDEQNTHYTKIKNIIKITTQPDKTKSVYTQSLRTEIENGQ